MFSLSCHCEALVEHGELVSGGFACDMTFWHFVIRVMELCACHLDGLIFLCSLPCDVRHLNCGTFSCSDFVFQSYTIWLRRLCIFLAPVEIHIVYTVCLSRVLAY